MASTWRFTLGYFSSCIKGSDIGVSRGKHREAPYGDLGRSVGPFLCVVI